MYGTVVVFVPCTIYSLQCVLVTIVLQKFFDGTFCLTQENGFNIVTFNKLREEGCMRSTNYYWNILESFLKGGHGIFKPAVVVTQQ